MLAAENQTGLQPLSQAPLIANEVRRNSAYLSLVKVQSQLFRPSIHRVGPAL
jgi:hypothetical protein